MSDWFKLRQMMQYIRDTKHLPLILEDDNSGNVRWHIDGAFAVHHNMRSHTGIYMTMGKGAAYASSRRQKLVTKSSTEAEIVGVDDGINQVLWTKYFLEHQGYNLNCTTVYQDNQSSILLERNGKASSTNQTKHINIRYFLLPNVFNVVTFMLSTCQRTK